MLTPAHISTLKASWNNLSQLQQAGISAMPDAITATKIIEKKFMTIREKEGRL